MCLKQKAPPLPPPVAQAPSRDTVAASTQDARRRTSEQRSTYGNIFTSVLGDSSYGSNVQSQRPTVASIGV